MTEEERDINLEDLFRKKLEGSETEPGGDLTGHFMRRLGRREFVRFNPARFNIFYLAGAAAAAATVSGLLFFVPGHDNTSEPALNDSLPSVEVTIPSENKAETVVSEAGNTLKIVTPGIPVTGEKAAPAPGTAASAERQTEIITAVKDGDDKGVMVVRHPEGNDISVSETGLPRVAIEASVTSGCVPLRVSFRNLTSGSYKTEWSFGDGGISKDTDADYIYDLPGAYTVRLTLTDARGRTAVTSTQVEVWPRPRAAFEIPETDIAITNDQVLFTNLSTGATQYLWDLGDGTSSGAFEPAHKYQRFGKYDVTLIAFSEDGCADSVTLADAFTDTGLFLRFPNAFMPTGGPTGGYYNQRSDEANQVFHPVSSGVIVYNLKIYSKQGMLVFESDDINMGWDGYYKGQLCSPGVYIWKVRGTYRNGEPIVMSGDVTLLNY